MRRAVTIVTVAAAAVVAVIALLWAYQRKLIYFPSQNLAGTALSSDIDAVSFPTEDGLRLSAWMVKADGDGGGPTIVMFHGNGGNRADRLPFARAMSERGYGVLLVDYRGYGGNPGSPSEEGLLADARAAVGYLETRPDVDGDRIVYFGESLGAAVAIGLADELPPIALVLRSPFTSLADIAAVHYPYLPVRLLLRDRYPSIERIRAIDVPVLVIAGSGDTIIPITQSEDIYEAASGPKRFVVVDGADHNDVELSVGDTVIAEITQFLDSLP
jgi:fermentation-respiration switch protein FrsA (DUF1100 family)